MSEKVYLRLDNNIDPTSVKSFEDERNEFNTPKDFNKQILRPKVFRIISSIMNCEGYNNPRGRTNFMEFLAEVEDPKNFLGRDLFTDSQFSNSFRFRGQDILENGTFKEGLLRLLKDCLTEITSELGITLQPDEITKLEDFMKKYILEMDKISSNLNTQDFGKTQELIQAF